MKKKVLVINYHSIVNDIEPAPKTTDGVFSVSKTSFEIQIQSLINKQVEIVSLCDLINNRLKSDFSVVITADDGNFSDYDIIYPFLKKNNMTATFFWLGNDFDKKFSKAQIDEMIMNNFVIGSHGLTHRDFTRMAVNEQIEELHISKNNLEAKTESNIEYFAFPYGTYNGKSLELARKVGYKAVLTSQLKLNTSDERPYLIYRWNVKKNTSTAEFERMISDQNYLDYRIKVASFKNSVKRLLGRKIADKLNVLFNS